MAIAEQAAQREQQLKDLILAQKHVMATAAAAKDEAAFELEAHLGHSQKYLGRQKDQVASAASQLLEHMAAQRKRLEHAARAPALRHEKLHSVLEDMNDVIAVGNSVAQLLGHATGRDIPGPFKGAPSRRFMSAAEQMDIARGFLEGLDDMGALAYPRVRAAIADIPADVDVGFADVAAGSIVHLRVYNVKCIGDHVVFHIDAVDAFGNPVPINPDYISATSPVFVYDDPFYRYGLGPQTWSFDFSDFRRAGGPIKAFLENRLFFGLAKKVWPAGVEIHYNHPKQKTVATIPGLNLIPSLNVWFERFNPRLVSPDIPGNALLDLDVRNKKEYEILSFFFNWPPWNKPDAKIYVVE
jgi:hypothetical protein